MEPEAVHDVDAILDRVEPSDDEGRMSLGDALEAVGRRSFGPLLLIAGLVMAAPVIGDIPGVPVLMGALVFFTAAQLLVGRDHVWLPDWLLRRSVARSKVRKTVAWLRPLSRALDRLSKRRWTFLIRHGGVPLMALACLLIAMATPAMEVVLFSANLAGVAILGYGLALLAHDGLIAVVSLAFTAATFAVVGWGLFG